MISTILSTSIAEACMLLAAVLHRSMYLGCNTVRTWTQTYTMHLLGQEVQGS